MRGVCARVVVVALAALALTCRAGDDADVLMGIEKVVPVAVSRPAVWALFDRSIEQGYVPSDGVIAAAFAEVTTVDVVKVYGPAPYRLRITGAAEQPIGFDEIDLSSVSTGWHTFRAGEGRGVGAVEVRFEPTVANARVEAPLPELEFWRSRPLPSSRSSDVSAAAGSNVSSAPQERLDIQPGECAGFPLTLPAQPEHLAHAYVAYTASGVRRGFALQRRINGGLTHGGAWMAATGVHAVVDEIDPRSLRRGVNDLTLCVPAEAAGPVTVDQARLLGRVDTGRDLVTQLRLDGKEAELAPVRDGDLATSVQVAGGQRLIIDLPRWIAPDAVVLAGSVEAVNASCLDREGVGHDLATVLQGDVLVLEGGAARCASLALTFARDAVIAELDVVGSGAAEPVDWPHLVLTSAAEQFGDAAWISGFVARPRSMSTAVRVRVGNDEVPSRTGEFGMLVRRASGETTPWTVPVTASFPDGSTDARVVELTAASATAGAGTSPPPLGGAQPAAASSSVVTALGAPGATTVGRAGMMATTRIRLGTRVGLDVPAGAVARPTDITLRHLGGVTLPPLDPGMINVTGPAELAYEFLPHGQRFGRPIDVMLPFDPALLPEGMSVDDVFTYFYDTARRRWTRLPRTALDLGTHVTHSATDHFTIMINSVLAVPKNAAPLALDPTAMAGMGAATPSANMDFIEPPTANGAGDARLGLAFRLPPGRGAYAPSLGLSYASSGANGWLGIAYGSVVRTTPPPSATGAVQTYAVIYDEVTQSFVTATTDGFGLSSRARIDLRFGIALEETDTNGAQLRRTLDGFGRVRAAFGPYETNQPGVELSYFPDEQPARAVAVTRASAPVAFTGTLPAPLTQVSFMDGLGRTIATRQSAMVDGVPGLTTRGLVGRDSVGRAARVFLPFFTAATSLGMPAPVITPATQRTFDAQDRVTSILHPDGAREQMAFGLAALPGSGGGLQFRSTATDPNGHQRVTYVDQLGRTRAFVEFPTPATPAITRYEYTALGEVARIIDAEGNPTTMSYDPRGLRTAFNSPDAGLIEERYDLMGNRVALVDPNHRAAGGSVRFTYDRDRLVGIDYPAKPDVQFVYGDVGAPAFGAGRLIAVHDETGSQAHSYGAMGELTRTLRTVRDPATPSQAPLQFEHRFITDSLGRQLELRYPDGETVANTYDAGGGLLAVTGRGAGWTQTYADQLTYDVYGNRTRTRFGNGAVSTWTFDPLRVRLVAATTTLPAAVRVQDLRYTYDPGGNPVGIRDLLPTRPSNGHLPGDTSGQFAYDGVDRLVRATGSGSVSPAKTTRYDLGFAYTASHNLVRKTLVHEVLNGGGNAETPAATNFDQAYAYGARPHLPTQVGPETLTYDPAGNLVRRRHTGTGAEQAYTWDDDGRLVQVTGASANQRNVYDAAGLRVVRNGSAGTTVFASPLYDLDQATKGQKHVFAGAVRIASVLGAFASSAAPAPPAQPGAAFYVHGDHLGSTAAVSRQDGTLNDAHAYFPDGQAWLDSGPKAPVNGYLYNGQPFDPETGLYDFGQRFYDPRTSLWLGIDPALADGEAATAGAPLYLSALAFSAHSPLRYVDPDGRQPREVPNVFNPNNSSSSAYRAWANSSGQRWTDSNPIISKVAPVVVRGGREILRRVLPPLVWDLFEAGLEEGSPTKQPASADPLASGLLPDRPGSLHVPGGAPPRRSGDGARPLSLTPEGAGRRGAFNEAKRNSGVPTSQQPDRVGRNLDSRGDVQPGRVYEFDVPAPGGGTRTVKIRDDSAGHYYGPGDPQNRGPHFNDPAGNHYDY